MLNQQIKLTPEIVNMILNSGKLNEAEKRIVKCVMDNYKVFFSNGRCKYFDNYLEKIYGESDKEFLTIAKLFILSFNLANDLFEKQWIPTFEDIKILSNALTLSVGFMSRLNIILLKCTINVKSVDDLIKYVKYCYNFELPSLPESMKKFCSFCFIKISDQPATINKEEYLITFIKKPTFNKLDCYIEDKHDKVIILSKLKILIYNISFEGKCYFIDKNNKKIDRNLGKVSFTFSFNNG